MSLYDTGASQPARTQEPPPIYQALAAVMRDVRAVGKDGWNGFHKFNFRGIDQTLNSVGPALRDHGVIVVPTVYSRAEKQEPTKNEGVSNRVTLEVRYRFLGPAGDSIDADVIGEAADTGDKATTKAMSVALRVALIQVLALPTQERDPDQDTYELASPAYDWDAERKKLTGDADRLLNLYRAAESADADADVLARIKADGLAARQQQAGEPTDTPCPGSGRSADEWGYTVITKADGTEVALCGECDGWRWLHTGDVQGHGYHSAGLPGMNALRPA